MLSKTFFKSSIIYTLSSALPLASAFFLLPFYTNLLNVSQFGQLALYISFTAIIQIIANFGLDTYIGISFFHHNHDAQVLKKHIGTVVGYLITLGTILSILWLAIGVPVFNLVFGNTGMQFYPYGIMSVFTAIFNCFFKTYINLLINQQRPERFLWFNLANFAMTIVFSLGGLYLYPNTLIGPMWGRLLSGIGIFLMAIIAFQKEFGIVISYIKINIRKTIAFVFPVTIFFILLWGSTNIDRYIINSYLNAYDVAIFDFGVKCTLLIEFLLNGLSGSIMPKIYSIIKEKKLTETSSEINKYFSAFSAITILIIPINYVAIPYLIPLFVIKIDYYQSFMFLPILSLGYLSRTLYNFYLAPLYYFEKTNRLPYIFIKSTAIQIVLTVVAVKYVGILGAAFVFMISRFIQVFFLRRESMKFFKFNFNKNKFLVLPLIFSGLVLVIEYTIYTYKIPIFARIGELLLAGVMTFYYYKQELKLLYNIYIKKYLRI